MAIDKELTAYEFLNLWKTECQRHPWCCWYEGGESKMCPFYYLGCGADDRKEIPLPSDWSNRFNKALIKKIKELRDATNTAEKPKEEHT